MRKIFAVAVMVMFALTAFASIGYNAGAVDEYGNSEVVLKGYITSEIASANATNIYIYDDLFSGLEGYGSGGDGSAITNTTATPEDGYYELSFNLTYAMIVIVKDGFESVLRFVQFKIDGTYNMNFELAQFEPRDNVLDGNFAEGMYGEETLSLLVDYTDKEYYMIISNETTGDYSVNVSDGTYYIFGFTYNDTLHSILYYSDYIDISDDKTYDVYAYGEEDSIVRAYLIDENMTMSSKFDFFDNDDEQRDDIETLEVSLTMGGGSYGVELFVYRMFLEAFLTSGDGYCSQIEAQILEDFFLSEMDAEDMFEEFTNMGDAFLADDEEYKYVPGSMELSMNGLKGSVFNVPDLSITSDMEFVYDEEFDYDGDIDFEFSIESGGDMPVTTADFEMVFPPYYDITNVDLEGGEILSEESDSSSMMEIEMDLTEDFSLTFTLAFRPFVDVSSYLTGYPDDFSIYLSLSDESAIGKESIVGDNGDSIFGDSWTQTEITWESGVEDVTIYLNVSSDSEMFVFGGWWDDSIIMVQVDGNWYKIVDGMSNSDIDVDIEGNTVQIVVHGELQGMRIDTNPGILRTVTDFFKSLNIL